MIKNILKRIADKISEFVYTKTDSEYLQECIDDFYDYHDIRLHWFGGIELPLVQQVFSEELAKNLLAVQPMDTPSGIMFTMNFDGGGEPYQPEPGDWGHSFLDGYYIYDEKCNQIFLGEDPNKYYEVHEQYKELNEERRKIHQQEFEERKRKMKKNQ